MAMRATVPLRLRLTLAFALSVALVLAGLAVFLYARMSVELRRNIDFGLRSRAGVVTTALAERGAAPVNSGRSLIDPDEAFAQVLDRTGRIIDTSSAVGRAPLLPAGTVRHLHRPTFISRPLSDVGDPTRLLAAPVQAGGRSLVVVVGTNLGDMYDALHRLLLLLALGVPAAVLVSSGAGWIVAGAGLRPVERMRRDAAAASLAKAGPALTVPATGDALARLATTLNDLLARQREALDAEHRFIDEASHDLRTPLAVLKAELDLALMRPRSPRELEQAVRTAAVQTDHLVHLAEDLLVHARTRRGPMPVHRERTRLAQFCAACVTPLTAQGRQITVQVDDDVVEIDPVLMRQAVRNLLDNASRHAAGTAVTLRAAAIDQQMMLCVCDAGPGLPEHLLGRLSRADTGADGLGLSIVAAIAHAHGGYAEAGAEPDGGASITIVVPTATANPGRQQRSQQ